MAKSNKSLQRRRRVCEYIRKVMSRIQYVTLAPADAEMKAAADLDAALDKGDGITSSTGAPLTLKNGVHVTNFTQLAKWIGEQPKQSEQ